MKVEFELNLDNDGRPCIRFKHHDKDNSLDQKALGIFINAVKEKGMCIKNPGGYIDTNGNSWEKYEIQINKSPA